MLNRSALSILKEKIFVQKETFYTFISKFWKILSGLVTLFFVITYFSAELQGYYYTFASLLLFQTLFELGFGLVLTQFINHEWAHLKFNDKNNIIEGPLIHKARLASILKIGLYFYSIVAIVFFIFAITFGLKFLSLEGSNHIEISKPWVLYTAGWSFYIFSTVFRCFMEGTNQIGKSQLINLVSDITSSICLWLGILFGAKLYSLAMLAIVLAGLNLALSIIQSHFSLKIFKQIDNNYFVSWKKDFFPLQWKIGLSWASGFFMFQSFVPTVFYLHGPIMAGQMGIALQAFNAINSLASIWLTSLSPRFGTLFVKKNIDGIQSLAKKIYVRSLAFSLFYSLISIIIIWQVKLHFPHFGNRFPDLITLILFFSTLAVLQLSNVETQAIRFQKKEPFLLSSITVSMLVVLSNLILGTYFGMRGIALGFFLIISIILIPWIHYIYKIEIKSLTKTYKNKF